MKQEIRDLQQTAVRHRYVRTIWQKEALRLKKVQKAEQRSLLAAAVRAAREAGHTTEEIRRTLEPINFGSLSTFNRLLKESGYTASARDKSRRADSDRLKYLEHAVQGYEHWLHNVDADLATRGRAFTAAHKIHLAKSLLKTQYLDLPIEDIEWAMDSVDASYFKTLEWLAQRNWTDEDDERDTMPVFDYPESFDHDAPPPPYALKPRVRRTTHHADVMEKRYGVDAAERYANREDKYIHEKNRRDTDV